MAEQSVKQGDLTLEETNKVRISLGLKPIGETGDGDEGEDVPVDTDAIAEDNYAERRAEMKRAKDRADIEERIAKTKNQQALKAKLKGSTLGADKADDSMSTAKWIKKQKKQAREREREMLAKRAREMEEQDQAVYDERDIEGLKVAHGVDDFETGEDVVLTLKDSRVLAGDEDELQNVNLIEDEAVKAAKERKRKAEAAYTGYDDDEFDENRIGKKADVLGKYDDEFSTGKVRTEGFRLGAAPVEAKNMVVDEDTEMLGMAPATKVKLNLDYTKDFEGSDYLKEGDAGFKKPKKKKTKRSARRAEADEEGAGGEGMEVDEPTFERRVQEDAPQNLVDDDDLQAALARSRRANARKKPKVKADDLVAQIAQRKEEEAVEDVKPDLSPEEDDGRITFDETSEFVRNVSLDNLNRTVKRERTSPAPGESVSAVAGPSGTTEGINGATQIITISRNDVDGGDEDEDMSEDEDEGLAEMAAREGMSLQEYRDKIDRQMQEMNDIKAEDVQEPATEPVVGNGMAGVLALLRQTGSLQKRTAEDAEREKIQKQKDIWLADYRARLAKRELERIQARGGNKDQAQREWENKMREQNEAREAFEIYKNYKPDVNIEYRDEFGRAMTPKEAWKSLSHKFHGKTSGRMKTEKRMRKIAEERKQHQMTAGDTPLGMSEAFARRQVKTGEAHMVLSVGNKASVQQGDGKGKVRR